jgi:outer membrane protein assembly factor BamA
MSLCLSLLFTAAVGAQQLPPGMKLEKVDVQGSTLFTPAEVAKMAGLRIGQDADLAGLSKAASALAAWGYFAAVQFSYRYTGPNLTVTFQLSEEKKLLQSVFDNFASLRDEEIVQAIRQDYPSFAGKVPGTGTANRFVQEKIEGLLAQKGSPSPVSFVEAGGMGKGQMVFRQERDTLICAVRCRM